LDHQILELHDELIDKHDDKIDNIQQDLTDIKVRLGIKDKTNGQVLKYQQELVEAQELERNERKEADKELKEDIKRLDDKTWYILTGVILVILLDIASKFMGGG
jgi:hypothetical protein